MAEAQYNLHFGVYFEISCAVIISSLNQLTVHPLIISNTLYWFTS